ncbi:MAG: hypothetical protein U0802_23365 [Candidatus Binatia bacterium]
MDYRYEVQVLSEDGEALGQLPFEPDWSPAIACVAFAARRRGALPAAAAAPGVVEPRWDPARGEPFVGGLRVRVDGVAPVGLPLAYLWPQAHLAALALVDAGTVRAGDVLRYRLRAVPAPAEAPAAAMAFAVEELDALPPVGAARLADFEARAERVGPAAEADELPVFVRRAVLDEAKAMARAQPDVEVGGVLLGRLLRDQSRPEIFLEVTAQVPARHTVAGATSLTFTAETWAAVDAALARRDRGETRCGWQHAHPNWCRNCPPESQRQCTRSNAFLSSEDLHLHRVVFGRGAHNVALLVSDNIHSGMTCSLYGWRHGLVAARGYHVIA